MRVKARQGFLFRDPKTARLITVSKGEELTFDHAENPQLIFELLGRLEIIDENFVPQRAKYLVVSYINYETKEGFPREGRPGEEVVLDQSIASQYLISGHIRPVSENQWRPVYLLKDTVKSDVVKRMFDTEEPPKENWVKKSGVRGWRD